MSSQYYRVTAYVGTPHRNAVEVTIPLVGPQGPAGPQGPQGLPGEVSGSLEWDNVTSKPTTFPPSAHTHQASEITDFTSAVQAVSPPADWNTLANKPSTFPPSSHGHVAADISDFSTAAAAAAPVQSVAGKTGAVTLAKADVGLGNVDNTSDLSKPISTATQTALDGKAATSHTHTANQVTDFATAAAAAAPVASVAGRTGAVTLAVADVANAVADTDARLSDARTPTSHTHGNITNDGKLGTTSGLPLVTTTAGAITTLALGSANQVLRVNSGATGVEFGAGFDAASPPAIGSTTAAAGTFTTLTASTSLAVTGGIITGASNVLEMVSSTNAQTLRIYRTSSSSNANYERGFIRWGGTSSNSFQIGTEKLGTGVARPLEFHTDGTLRAFIRDNGDFSVGLQAVTDSARPFHLSGSSMWARIDRTGTNGPAWMMVRQATYSNNTSVWLFGPHNAAGASNDDFAITDYGATVTGTSGTTRLTIGKSDGQVTLNGNLNLSTKDLVTDTTTGTKIGTATSQKIGFFNATPVVQQAAVADATDAASTQARLNDLLARLRTLGLIAT